MSTRGKEVLFSKLENNSLEMESHQLEWGAVAQLRKHCFNELQGTPAQMLEDFCNYCVSPGSTDAQKADLVNCNLVTFPPVHS